MRCADCKFFVPAYSSYGFDKSKGQCEIRLPPHVAILYYEGDVVDVIVESSYGCDLGQPK